MSRPVALQYQGRATGGRLALRGSTAVFEEDGRRTEADVAREGPWIEMRIGGKTIRAATARDARGIWVHIEGRVYRFEIEHRGTAARETADATGEIRAPMTGRVASVETTPGARAETGDLLLTIEAMKMEFKLTAPMDGLVVELRCAAGDTVELGQLLARMEAASGAVP